MKYHGRFHYFTAYPEKSTRIKYNKESTRLFTEKIYSPANNAYPNTKTIFAKENVINHETKTNKAHHETKTNKAHHNNRSMEHNNIVYSFEHISKTSQSENRITTSSKFSKAKNGDVRLLLY